MGPMLLSGHSFQKPEIWPRAHERFLAASRPENPPAVVFLFDNKKNPGKPPKKKRDAVLLTPACRCDLPAATLSFTFIAREHSA